MSKCKEGKSVLTVYPYVLKNEKGRVLSSQSLVQCEDCQTHELLPMPCQSSTTVNLKFAKQLWKRLHGWEQLVEGEDKNDPNAKKRYRHQDRVTLSSEVLQEFLVTAPKGTPLSETFTVVDYTPEE